MGTRDDWKEAELAFKQVYPDARAVLVASVVRIRYRVFANGRYWGQSHGSYERAWLDAFRELEHDQKNHG
jgi:hypothetical protein